MEAELQTHVAFHLTGKRPAADLDAVEELILTPALLARYRDLGGLRYDYPVVLVRGPDGTASVEALSAIIDALLREIAQGDDGARVSRHVLRMEAAIRRLAATGRTETLAALWTKAASQLATTNDDLLADSLARARAALKLDGDVCDCDTALPARVFAHAAESVYQRKAKHFRNEVQRLIQKLSDILRADFVGSSRGRTPESLKAAVGSLYEDAFDFGAMSKVLARGSADTAMPEARRARIGKLLTVLQSQRFYPLAARDGGGTYAFGFASCQDALRAYRERMPEVTELARTIAMAELEIAGEYREARHDAYFDDFGESDIDPQDLALFPDYVVCVPAARLDAADNATLMHILSAGLPMKILVQTEDILDEAHVGDGHLGFGTKSRQLAHMAMGLNDVFVVQTSASHLFQYRDRLARAIAFRGPALVSCYAPAGATTPGLAPYLVAAAAMESRAFPAFTYDPSAGSDWASRFDLESNPQVEADWPTQPFDYEDEKHQRASEDLGFTLVDFIACDVRFRRHFARVPRSRWTTAMVPTAQALATGAARPTGPVPCCWMVDSDDHLQKVLVDEKLMREARRCREMWHSLQELGGIHNSHAERLLAKDREAREALAAQQTSVPEPAATSAPAPAEQPAPAASAAAAEPEGNPDEAYIETPRCTTCNECINLNGKMFGYNENQQAMIKDASAGTYAELVEAAENCQVAIIHPGKPRDPKEPGLEALLERAKPFL